MTERDEKQAIEKMAEITKAHCKLDNLCGSCHWETCNDCFAEVLYNADYRKQEWISVEDRLPEEEQIVLYYNGTNVGVCYFYSGHFHIIDFYDSDKIERVTHWVSLPEPPRKEGSA